MAALHVTHMSPWQDLPAVAWPDASVITTRASPGPGQGCCLTGLNPHYRQATVLSLQR